MTSTRDDNLVILAVLADAPVALIIAELERRGWERGLITIADETYDMLLCERDEGQLPFEFEPDFGDEALSA